MIEKKTNWVVAAKRADFKKLSERLSIDPVTVRLLVNRDISEDDMEAFLHPSAEDKYDPILMKDMTKAVEILADAVSSGTSIRVIGDYDVDGIFSTYILVTALQKCGGRVDYDIPHRVHDGYGVNEQMIERAHESGIGLVMTCDNGIAAREALSLAKSYGMTVVVTDHHEIPFDLEDDKKVYKLPPADAVVDPHREDDDYPFAGICGAQVAYKFAAVFYEHMGRTRQDAVSDFMEMAAFAAICDIMELRDENRALVYHGLKKLSRTENVGLSALLKRCDLWGESLDAFHVGFRLGPCFNASGRLDSALMGLELLFETDEKKALALADSLFSLNEQRKVLTEKGMEMAMEALEGQEIPRVLVVYIPELHESLCGIVAGRLKEKLYRPVFVLCDGEGVVKGSGRSIPGFSMFEEMQKVEELFVKYGGHPMAAGLSLDRGSVDEFRRRINENCSLTEEQLIPKVLIDVPMPLSYITMDLVRQIESLAPFGNGNEKPVFADKDLRLIRITSMGKEKQHRRLLFDLGGGRRMEAVYFREGNKMDEYLVGRFGREAFEAALGGRENQIILQIVYYPSINCYNGRETLQVIIDDYR